MISLKIILQLRFKFIYIFDRFNIDRQIVQSIVTMTEKALRPYVFS